jgi:ADP-ribosylglycohydrolase
VATGAGAHEILSAIAGGVPWRAAAGAAFGGQGSAGNGAAMRVAPVGAYFAGDLPAAADHAARSAAPTHAHPEGVDGAVAIAVLAAQVFAGQRDRAALLAGVLAHVRPGDVRRGLSWVAEHLDADAHTVAATVGNGAHVRAGDTVPFAVWCTLRHLGDFAGAVWTCGDVGGDVDTTAAMCGGVIVGAVGAAGLPAAWRAAVEPLP